MNELYTGFIISLFVFAFGVLAFFACTAFALYVGRSNPTLAYDWFNAIAAWPIGIGAIGIIGAIFFMVMMAIARGGVR